MQRKSLDSNIGIDDFNKKVFNKSMELFFNCKKISIDHLSSTNLNQSIKKKYNAIDEKLQNMLKILRNFTDAEKPTFNNPIDLATQILEQTKLQVQIQFRKKQQQKNTVRKVKAESTSKQSKPQDMYPQIKAYNNFDEHSHQNYLQDGMIASIKACEVVQNAKQLKDDYLYVDTPQKLEMAIGQMRNASQVAVDVQHSAQSYQGFTCLIQISTRQKDYIIDVFPIWSQVQALQQIIGNPNILKVMHGAEMDTKWLQRDFNIHIVNLFDTHKASRVLGMTKFSYAFLLSHYCAVNTNKVFQRADWRERPLSGQMIKYARMDTHYLLQIFDHLRIDLQKQSKNMNLSFIEVFKDIQRSSHEVTLANAQLFSYTTKQLYINLQFQLKNKKEQFKAIQSIFSELNIVAMNEDQNFEDLIPKRDLIEAISLIKDLVFNKSSKVSKQSRIQKIIGILKRSAKTILNSAIFNIKTQLYRIFCTGKQINEVKPNNTAPIKIYNYETSKNTKIDKVYLDIQNFTRSKTENLKFKQFGQKSLVINQDTKKMKISFTPIIGFLSTKYGIQQVKQQEPNAQQQSKSQMEDESQVMKQQNEQENDGKNGMIQFKRMNPNVIYTIEDQDPEVSKAMAKHQPRKMRKQTQYQNRIRNKTGNIYQMLDNN